MAAVDLGETAVTPDLAALADSWALSLEAENKAARTVAIYTESVHYLAAFLPVFAFSGLGRAVKRLR